MDPWPVSINECLDRIPEVLQERFEREFAEVVEQWCLAPGEAMQGWPRGKLFEALQEASMALERSVGPSDLYEKSGLRTPPVPPKRELLQQEAAADREELQPKRVCKKAESTTGEKASSSLGEGAGPSKSRIRPSRGPDGRSDASPQRMPEGCPKWACAELERLHSMEDAMDEEEAGMCSSGAQSSHPEKEKLWESDPESGDGGASWHGGSSEWHSESRRRRWRGGDEWRFMSYKSRMDSTIAETIQILRYENGGDWICRELFMQQLSKKLGVEVHVLECSEAVHEALHSRSKRRREPRFVQYKGKIKATEK